MMSSKRASTFSLIRSTQAWLIVCCGMLFYCYNYFLRVSPSVLHEEIIQTFHINASEFGLLIALYYYAYTPMQIPAGILYDKFGARFVLVLSALTAVFGLQLFINASNIYMAGFGRFMIGLGGAFAYIGTLKLASVWLPENRFATAAGLTTAVGMLCGALSQKYLIHFIELVGYQTALRNSLIAGVILSGMILLCVRNRSNNPEYNQNEMSSPMSYAQVMGALKLIFTSRQMWLIGIIGCLLYLPSSVFLDAWGIPYLKTVYEITPEQAVNIANVTFYGWIISGPIIGYISDKIKRRKLPLAATGFFAALLLCLVFYFPDAKLSIHQLYLAFFIIGFCCGAHPLCFAMGKENNPIQISGTAVAITNMLIMAGGAIFQPLVGKLLDLHSANILDINGLPIYSSSDYQFALSVVPIGVAIGILLSFFLKETYCESQASKEDEHYFKATILDEELEERTEHA